MRKTSITLRLTLFFIVASTTVLICVGLWIGESVRNHFEEQDYAELNGKLELIRHALTDVRSPSDLVALPQRLDDALIGHTGLSVAVWSSVGKTVFTAGAADFPRSVRVSVPTTPKSVQWESGSHAFRGLAASVHNGMPDGTPFIVAVALDIGHHQAFMSTFGKTLWVSILLGVGLTGVLGWIAARRGLSPLRQISQVAQNISARHLDARLPVDTVPTELIGLATSFNDMIARLEDSFQRLSDFSSDIAHELRTPVSNLMTQTQVALTKARTTEEYREILYSNQEEYERLSRMIGDMLFLAKAENGLIVPGREAVDLGATVDMLIDFYESFAAERGVRMVRTGNATFNGDRLMLRRAIGNILSNAIHHSQTPGVVTVKIEDRDTEGARISIENPGADISPEHLPRLFDRFYRVDPARQRNREGVGLGLAIAQSIARAHGGQITASSGHGFTRFDLDFKPFDAPQ